MSADAPESAGASTESQLFEGLTTSQKDNLLGNAIERRHPKNTVIYAPGDESTVLYCLATGRVKIYDLTADGREIIYRFCGPGSWFGLSAIFGGEARPAFAETQAETKVYVIDVASFEGLIQDNPKFAVAVIHVLGERLRQAHAAITEFVVGDVRSRTAQLLLKFAETGGRSKGGIARIENRFTHQEIANMIGATRTTVTKIFNEWKRMDIVDIADGHILIQDREALSRLIRH